MSSPGVKPAFSMASMSSWSGASLLARFGGEAALVAHRGGQALVVQDGLEHVVGLGAPAQRLGEAGRTHRHDHELLEVHVVVGVGAAVEHVHHRHRQHVGVGAAHVAVQRDVQLDGGGLGDGERGAQDGVGAQAGLVVGAVEIEQGLIAVALVQGVAALELVADLAVHVGHGDGDALAAVAVAAVSQLDRLELTGGGARGHRGTADGTGVEDDLDLDGGVAAGVEDLAADDGFDGAHGGGVAPGAGGEKLPVRNGWSGGRDRPRAVA